MKKSACKFKKSQLVYYENLFGITMGVRFKSPDVTGDYALCETLPPEDSEGTPVHEVCIRFSDARATREKQTIQTEAKTTTLPVA